MVLLGSFQRVMAVSKNSAQGWGSFVPGMPASLMLALAFSMCVCGMNVHGGLSRSIV